ncbi:MAG: hypothetical protein RIS31_551 [Actinomycetota bacterium]|jgi:alanine racemase
MTVTKNVDLNLYRNNLQLISQLVSPARVMAVVKADAYGHGLIPVAKAAVEAGIDFLGVLDIETGLKLRTAGVSANCFAWLHSPQSDFAKAVFAGIELSAGSLVELRAIAAAPGRAQVHLKLDSGLSRNGCRIENWAEFVSLAMELENRGEINVVAIWTHLSGTSQSADQEALQVFDTATETARELGFKGYRHAASSPAAFAIPQSRFDLVRIGVSAFGTSPIEGVKASELGLAIPMAVTAEVLAPKVISIGFLHGYFSQLADRAKVEIEGKLYKVLKVGPLATEIESGDYEPGDLVTVFGDENSIAPTAEELCELLGTVTDELFTGLKANLTNHSS